MSISDDELKEKVIKHDYEFKALTKGMEDMVKGLHELTISLRETINEKMSSMDSNLKDSFSRVYVKQKEQSDEIKAIKEVQNNKGCHALSKMQTELDILNRAMFGKDGRGGVVFDVEDIKKFIYKAMGAFTILNFVIGIAIYSF